MRDTKGSSNSQLQSLILSAGMNLVVTFTTIAGGGWAIHREIMHDVSESQNESKRQIEDKLVTILNSKLERQPTEFRIDTQSEQLRVLAEDIKKTQERIISIDARLEQMTQTLKGRPYDPKFK